MTTATEEIRTANRTFMDLFRRGDAAGIAGLYTADARLLPPDHAMMNGTHAIRSFWQGAMDMGVKAVALETLTVDARDDHAYEVGKYILTLHPAGGQRTEVGGKYVVVWQKRNGGWKLHVDIWNAGGP